jgi:N-acetylglucosamine malate deacetylase 2
MSREIMARMSGRVGVPPAWTSVLAVIAHPDEASCGLGAILDAFVFAGVKVKVLCLTHGQAWTLQGAPGDLAALRGAELASAADVLGPTRADLLDLPDGDLSKVGQARLVAEVVAAADSCFPDGLLVFDTQAEAGRLDHVTASSAGLQAAETLGLPVLGWALSETVMDQLRHEFGPGSTDRRDEEIDLRVNVDRARVRVASYSLQGQALPGSARWRRLELLAGSERRFTRGDGEVVWMQHSIGLLRDQSGDPVSYVSQMQDITQTRHAAAQMAYRAAHDQMTGLLNRGELTNLLEAALTRKTRTGTRLAVLYCDVDAFKAVNDGLGHAAGDALLVATGKRIASSVRDSDTVARVGGDEFVVILDGVHHLTDAERIASQIHEAASTQLEFQGNTLNPKLSIGVTIAKTGQNVDDVLRDADDALYAAKAAGGDRVVVFDPDSVERG